MRPCYVFLVMSSGGDQRRFVTLVGVSLALHAGALGWMATRPPPPPAERASRPIEMEFITVPPPTPEVEPKAPEPVAAVTPVKKKKTEVTAVPEQQPSGPVAEGNTTPTASEGIGQRGDLPVASRPSLVPSSGFIMQLGPAGTNDSGRGTTVRNGPGEAPDQASLNEYTGEVLTRKLNTDLREEVGRAAVEVGNVPTHFKRYESAMRAALPKAKIERTPMTAKEAIADAAGVVFGGPSDSAVKKVTDTATGRSITSGPSVMPNVEDQRAREAGLAMMVQGEAIRERMRRARLRTVLELTTDATGALADVSVIEKSGDERFDESVIHFSRKVARTIPDADDKLLGATMWRTRWQFTWEPPDVRVRLINAVRVPQ